MKGVTFQHLFSIVLEVITISIRQKDKSYILEINKLFLFTDDLEIKQILPQIQQIFYGTNKQVYQGCKIQAKYTKINFVYISNKKSNLNYKITFTYTINNN